MKRTNLADRMKKQTETFINGSTLDTDTNNELDKDNVDNIDTKQNNKRGNKQYTTQYTNDVSNNDTNKENIQLNKNNNIDTNIEVTKLDVEEDSIQNIKQDTMNVAIENKPKLTIQKPNFVEPYDNRLVANVTKSQKAYIKRIGKNFENESAFVRFMIDYFRENVEIE